jgi:regulator of protease activity HflC (stomatin/prohibitin superfamily)
MNLTIIGFVLALTMAFILHGSRVVRENHRYIIFRLGRFIRVTGPGIVFLFPHIDTAINVDLNQVLPNWLTMSETDVNEQLRLMALTGKFDPENTRAP